MKVRNAEGLFGFIPEEYLDEELPPTDGSVRLDKTANGMLVTKIASLEFRAEKNGVWNYSGNTARYAFGHDGTD